MVTGYSNASIAEARQRIDELDKELAQFKSIIQAATAAEQKRQDSTEFYKAARKVLMAASADLDLFKDFINLHGPDLEAQVGSGGTPYFTPLSGTQGIDFYRDKADSYEAQIAADESILVVPASGIVGGVPPGKADPSFDGIVTQCSDGDTIVIDDSRVVRFAGIDAPESGDSPLGGQSRGTVAKKVLENLILGKKVHVGVDFNTKFDMYNRWLGVIYLLEDNPDEGLKAGANINVEMLFRCMADDNEKFGKNHYVDPHTNKQAAERCVMGWPMQAELALHTKPSGCEVLIDGRETGHLSGKSGKGALLVPIGRHVITMYKLGYGALHVVQDFESKKYDLSYDLLPIGENEGLVEIHTIPIASIVLLGGNPVGLSTVVTTLPANTETIVGATSSKYEPHYTSVKGLLGQIVKVVIDLTQPLTDQDKMLAIELANLPAPVVTPVKKVGRPRKTAAVV